MKNIVKLAAISLLLVAVPAFAYKNSATTNNAQLTKKARINHENVIKVIETDSDLSTLSAALKAHGLDNELIKTDAKFTVFAPTNAAIAKAGAENITAETLKSHVVSGKKALTLKELENRKRLNTLSGSRKVTYQNHHVYIDGVKVSRIKEFRTKNGNVYIIDEVLKTTSK